MLNYQSKIYYNKEFINKIFKIIIDKFQNNIEEKITLDLDLRNLCLDSLDLVYLIFNIEHELNKNIVDDNNILLYKINYIKNHKNVSYTVNDMIYDIYCIVNNYIIPQLPEIKKDNINYNNADEVIISIGKYLLGENTLDEISEKSYNKSDIYKYIFDNIKLNY